MKVIKEVMVDNHRLILGIEVDQDDKELCGLNCRFRRMGKDNFIYCDLFDQICDGTRTLSCQYFFDGSELNEEMTFSIPIEIKCKRQTCGDCEYKYLINWSNYDSLMCRLFDEKLKYKDSPQDDCYRCYACLEAQEVYE